MADPAPSGPLPDAAPESRVSPADQMAGLTGEPVELSQPAAADEPAEDHDASTSGQIGALAAMAPFEGTAPAAAAPSNDPTKHAPATTSDSAETPVSPPAPRVPMSSAEPPRAPDATPPDPSPPAGVKPQQGQPRSPQGTAPLTATAIVAAALTGGLRRAEPPAAASIDARARTPSLVDRLAVKSILDNLRRPEAKASASQTVPTTGVAESMTAADATATAPKAASPAGGLRDKLGVFTADRMQARRDAEEIKGVTQSGAAVLGALEALERHETTGILLKIRDAANANGGMERVLSEMRPGGAFEDLRKEFNVALSHDEGFAAAYEKATGALSSYAETRAGMISAPRPRADVNLARLETLDQEIGAAARTLPGLKDGKNALDEALEGGREAVEKAFTAIRQAFTRDAEVRGPSPSPRFGP
jgi:hypothetical protein